MSADLVEGWCALLDAGSGALEAGEAPTDAWRASRREFDARLRAAAESVGSALEDPTIRERLDAAHARFGAALRASMAANTEAVNASGRARRGHRAYLSRPTAPSYYVQTRS